MSRWRTVTDEATSLGADCLRYVVGFLAFLPATLFVLAHWYSGRGQVPVPLSRGSRLTIFGLILVEVAAVAVVLLRWG